MKHSGVLVQFKKFILFLLLSMGVSHAYSEPIAPDFELRKIDSEQSVALRDYRGKVIYLDFWASWCGPCRQSLPALDQLQRELGNEEFEVLAINLDGDPADGIEFLQQYPVSYTVLTDRTGRTSRAYDLVGLPTSVLIDQHGVLVSSFQGFHPSHIEKLKKAINILTDDTP